VEGVSDSVDREIACQNQNHALYIFSLAESVPPAGKPGEQKEAAGCLNRS
jgi:hypothetical protein